MNVQAIHATMEELARILSETSIVRAQTDTAGSSATQTVCLARAKMVARALMVSEAIRAFVRPDLPEARANRP